MTITLNGDTGIIQSGLFDSNSDTGFKNRIINGAMVIDQRNNGAALTPIASNNFIVDRFIFSGSQASKFFGGQNYNSVTPPIGFKNYAGVQCSTAYTVLAADIFRILHRIEGFNAADFAWGSVNAQPVTLSFNVYSSLTGTFGGSLANSGSSRTYPFSYTVPVANTWTQVNLTIPGETTGTWLTNNGIGVEVNFGLGVGSTYSGAAGNWSGTNYFSTTGAVSVVGTQFATFYITGVQLEKGSVATGFDYRSYGTELALCQRYYYKNLAGNGARFAPSYNYATTGAQGFVGFPVTMRIAPTALEQSGTAADYAINYLLSSTACNAVPIFVAASSITGTINMTVASGLTAGQGSNLSAASANGYLAWSAEL